MVIGRESRGILEFAKRLYSKTNTTNTIKDFTKPVYPPRKQMIWSQCESYFKSRTIIFIQLDNLSATRQKSFKQALKKLGLSLKTPKPGIMRKYITITPELCRFTPAIVGFTSMAISNADPCTLLGAINYIRGQEDVSLIAGKIESALFTAEGIEHTIANIKTKIDTQSTLVHSIESSSQTLTSMLNRPAQSLASTLSQIAESSPNNKDVSKDV